MFVECKMVNGHSLSILYRLFNSYISTYSYIANAAIDIAELIEEFHADFFADFLRCVLSLRKRNNVQG